LYTGYVAKSRFVCYRPVVYSVTRRKQVTEWLGLMAARLHVPLVDEGPFPHPSGDGRQFTVKWAQDDEGRLLVLGCNKVLGCNEAAQHLL
jgi:hypothetical protein